MWTNTVTCPQLSGTILATPCQVLGLAFCAMNFRFSNT